MQIQTCSQPGFTLPDISRYRRWAFTPPLHLYCINSNIFSVALSSPSRALGFPKQACYFDCPDFPHNPFAFACQAFARLARPKSMDFGLFAEAPRFTATPFTHFCPRTVRWTVVRSLVLGEGTVCALGTSSTLAFRSCGTLSHVALVRFRSVCQPSTV